MALNLWKLGGRPTSYNPLPVGTVNSVYVGLGDFAITFKAKSPSNAALKIGDVGEQDLNQTIALSNEFKTYSFTFKSTAYQQIYFYDNISKGDIIIDSIELVQKPLPKLTINGIDGFNSGKWTLHANAKVIDDETLVINSTGTYQDGSINVSVKPNTQYTISWETMGNKWGLNYLTQSGVYISGAYRSEKFYTFTTPSNCENIKIYPTSELLTTGQLTFKRPMLNLGPMTVPYERKRGERMVLPVANGNGTFQLNPKPKKAISKAKTGLSFNGITDYLQLPSMTMDSIEIECLIDSVQGASNYLVDARSGLTNGYVYHSGIGVGWSEVKVNGVVQTGNIIANNKGERKKFLMKASAPFTDDVTIFAKWDTKIEFLKVTLYKVTCYLNGSIVAQYDFENPSNIVGDKELNGVAKNLIPSFEDPKWSLHANTQVLGKDWLRLNATGGSQRSTININVIQGVKYLITCGFGLDPNHRVRVNSLNADGSIGTNILSINQPLLPFTWTSDRTGLVNFAVDNTGSGGTLDFTKPSIYQLDSKEGTIVGAPAKLNKAPKRTLYAKR